MASLKQYFCLPAARRVTRHEHAECGCGHQAANALPLTTTPLTAPSRVSRLPCPTPVEPALRDPCPRVHGVPREAFTHPCASASACLCWVHESWSYLPRPDRHSPPKPVVSLLPPWCSPSSLYPFTIAQHPSHTRLGISAPRSPARRLSVTQQSLITHIFPAPRTRRAPTPRDSNHR
jgi:hypothetical protein